MPIYEYDCGDCRTMFSLLRGINDASRPACPKCGGDNVEKRMSTFCCSGSSSEGSMPASSGHA